MVIRRESSNTSSNVPLRIWLLAGGVSVALAAGVILLSAGTVHANAFVPRATQSAPPGAPTASATPDLIAPHKPAGSIPAEMLHGIASWYGGVFNGRRTASGERFDMYAMTACHPTLPFGTLVEVMNLSNRRAVTVKITDRGDLVDEGRIIDLSYGAARKLGMLKDGLVPVELKVIHLGGKHDEP
ncbi:MAG: septal ring lytic transglycosylase RlpA family protein [Terracidiphilus sp.]